MSTGRVHAQASLLLALPSGLIAFYLSSVPVAVGVALGCGIVGQLLSPDLDQDGRTRSEKIVMDHVPVLGWFWLWGWYPYASLIPHRHWSSHGVLIGTVLRWLYCIAVSLAVAFVFRKQEAVANALKAMALIPIVQGMFLGSAVSDVAHWGMDKISTWHNRRRLNRRRRRSRRAVRRPAGG